VSFLESDSPFLTIDTIYEIRFFGFSRLNDVFLDILFFQTDLKGLGTKVAVTSKVADNGCSLNQPTNQPKGGIK